MIHSLKVSFPNTVFILAYFFSWLLSYKQSYILLPLTLGCVISWINRYLIRKHLALFLKLVNNTSRPMHTFCMLLWDNCGFIFRASYDTSAPNLKRKCLDEGETDEDKVEEYKASANEIGLCMVEKKLILLIDSSHLESWTVRCAKILMSNIYVFS